MKFEFSAGGVVYRKNVTKKKILKQVQDDIKILVAQHSQHHGWVFPKGLIGESGTTKQKPGKTKETKEEAALREVEEETGVQGKIVKELEPVTYWYQFEGEKIRKTVYYFLMEYLSGDIRNHDFEMEKVEWLPMDEVLERLTYKSDKDAWNQARKLIDNG